MNKKKIKDLTIQECAKICKSNFYCANCPLFTTHRTCLLHDLELDTDTLEKEIEV